MINRKLLTTIFLLAVMLVLPQGAWATELTADVKYSLTTTGDGTVTGGTFAKSGVNNYDDTSEPKRWTMKNTGAYIQCTMNNALAVGDKLIIVATPRSTSSAGFAIRLEGSNSAAIKASIKPAANKKDQELTLSYTITAEDGLAGENVIYVMITDTSHLLWISSISVLSGSTNPAAITANTTWDYSVYDAPTSATAADFVNSKMLLGSGIKMGTETEFSGYTGYLLNLAGNHNGGFDAANGHYLMFKLPANTSGSFVISHMPYGNSNKSLAYKIGAADAQTISTKGKAILTSDAIAFNTTVETPVYIYVSSNHSTYYIKSIAVTFTAPTIPITTIDYATFSSGLDLDFSGCSQKAYIVTGETSGTLTYQQVTKVPAGTGLLLVGAAGDNVTPTILTGDADDVTGNLLKATLTATTVGTTEGADHGKVWVLGNLNSTPGFYKANKGRTLTVGKAYLYLESGIAGAREFFPFDFDNETTGINAVQSSGFKVNDYYNLNGQRVAQPTKGLYIVNGKKVVIK